MTKNSHIPENKSTNITIANYIATGNLEKLHEYYWRSWYYFALNITKNKSLAEDCVSDFCEKLLGYNAEKRKSIFEDAIAYEEAILFCILRNLCVDQLRKQHRRQHILLQLFTTIEEVEINTAHKNDLLVITNLLAPRQREILLLHTNGYSNTEIAAQLNISYHSVKNTLSDAKSKFKLWYNKL